MKELIKQIEALMSENEAVKVNATKIVIANPNNETSRRLFNEARIENVAYQNVLELINSLVVKEVENGQFKY